MLKIVTSLMITGSLSLAANSDQCSTYSDAIEASYGLVSKSYDLDEAKSSAKLVFALVMHEGKANGLMSLSKEFSILSTARSKIFDLERKKLGEVTAAELAEYVYLKKIDTSDTRSFQLQKEIEIKLADALSKISTTTSQMANFGYKVEIMDRSVGGISVIKQIPESKVLKYETMGGTSCHFSRAQNTLVMEFQITEPGSYSMKLDRYEDGKMAEQGCQQTDLGFVLMNLTSVKFPQGCDFDKLNKQFSVVPLK